MVCVWNDEFFPTRTAYGRRTGMATHTVRYDPNEPNPSAYRYKYWYAYAEQVKT
jgi:hypothetical protein